jgi:hypothetical protein
LFLINTLNNEEDPSPLLYFFIFDIALLVPAEARVDLNVLSEVAEDTV